ncbi:hypothetical protein ACJZ2D_015424 [Fusarium nematophilum]
MFSKAALNMVFSRRQSALPKTEPRSRGGMSTMSQPTMTDRSTLLTTELQARTVVLHGCATELGEAYVLGQVHMNLNEPVELEILEAEVLLYVRHKRPFTKDCSNCVDSRKQLQRWDIVTGPTTLPKGKHVFDIGFAIPNQCPASMNTSFVAVVYELLVRATSSEREPLVHSMPFEIQRSLRIPAEAPLRHHVFSGSGILASLSLDKIIRPSDTPTVHLRLDRIESPTHIGLEVWKLKKLSWRLEESTTAIFEKKPAASRKKTGRVAATEPKSHSETRLLGKGSLTQGWQEHHNDLESHITCDFNYSRNVPCARVREADMRVTSKRAPR